MNWEEISKHLNCFNCKKEWATEIIFTKPDNTIRFCCPHCMPIVWKELKAKYGEVSSCSLVLLSRKWTYIDNNLEKKFSLVDTKPKWAYWITKYNSKKYNFKNNQED